MRRQLFVVCLPAAPMVGRRGVITLGDLIETGCWERSAQRQEENAVAGETAQLSKVRVTTLKRSSLVFEAG